MEPVTTKTIITGILVLIVIVTGVWLKKTGQPYKKGIFAIHKLISLAIIIILGFVVFEHSRDIDFKVLGWTLMALTGTFLIIAIITGAMLEKEELFNKLVKILHRFSSILALIMIPVVWLICH